MSRAGQRNAARLRSLAELGAGWAAQAQVRQHSQREAVREHERRRVEHAAPGLFARSVGPVFPLRAHPRAEVEGPKPAPHPRQRELDEKAAVRASLSDEVTLESLLLTDDGLSFRRPGIAADVVTRLRRGQWALQGQIDLHGCTRDQARDALAGFIRENHRRGLRCLRVVHGKGHGSPGREPVLKAKVLRWLAQSAEVIAFAQASGPQGGAGALLVLLAGQARSPRDAKHASTLG